jgi:prephenate dehydrogenase
MIHGAADTVGTSSSAAKPGRVIIVGVGLMGGSLGMALIESGIVQEVVGIDSPRVLDDALKAGAIHVAGDKLEDAVGSADLVILATPIHVIPALLVQIAPYVAVHAAVTDLASVKCSIVREGERLLGERFVGGHPMAGSEQTGLKSARSTLFRQAAWALTPSDADKYSAPRMEMLCNVVRAVGAKPTVMSPIQHDRAAAMISHLPHLICYAYNKTVESSSDKAAALSLAAGSYRDLTRVAVSDPILWRDVFVENREFLLNALGAFKDSLITLEDAVKSGCPEQILESILVAGNSS